jgi:predicted Rossmann fold nucleotide-binding protein DprA/Smf involved in DNA uptake
VTPEIARRESLAAARRDQRVAYKWIDQKTGLSESAETESKRVREAILRALEAGPMTTQQVRAKTGLTMEQVYRRLAMMDSQVIVQRRDIVVNGHTLNQWSLVRTP